MWCDISTSRHTIASRRSTSFERLAKELQEIMAKGYESIEEFRGKLKDVTKTVKKFS